MADLQPSEMELELRRLGRPRRVRSCTGLPPFASLTLSAAAPRSGPNIIASLAAAAPTKGKAAPAKTRGAVSGPRPSLNRLLLRNPVAVLSLVPRELAMFVAGGVAGAIAKTTTAPLDRVRASPAPIAIRCVYV